MSGVIVVTFVLCVLGYHFGSVPVLDVGGLQHIVFSAQGCVGHSGVGAVTAWSSYVGSNLHVFSVQAAQLSLQLGVLGGFCGLALISARLVIFGGILVFNGGVGW